MEGYCVHAYAPGEFASSNVNIYLDKRSYLRCYLTILLTE